MKKCQPSYITPDAAKLSQAPLPVGEKERARRELQSLAPQIEKAARESAERRRLEATVEQHKKLAAERKKPILEQVGLSAPVGKGRAERKAKRDAAKLAEISVQLTRQRENARRARQRRGEYDGDNSPTLERLAKLEAEGGQTAVDQISPPIKDDDTLSTAKAHEVQGVVKFYQRRWTHEELTGARYLVRVFDAVVMSSEGKTTPAYDGTPVTGASSRKTTTPTLAEMTEEAAAAAKRARRHEHWMFVEGMLYTRFGEKGVNVIRWFVWETHRVAREGTPLGDQMVAAGRALAPFVEDEARLKGVTLGWLQAIFRFAYGQWSVPEEAQRQRDASQSTDTEIAARRRMRQAQLAHNEVTVDEEIAAQRKGLTVLRGGKT